MVTKGVAKYVYLDSTEKFKGKDTEKYSLTIAVDSKEAKKLEAAGVKVKTLKDEDGKEYLARKFSTQWQLKDDMIRLATGEIIGSDFGAESLVEVLWKGGDENPNFGTPTYLTAIKVLERTPGYKSRKTEDGGMSVEEFWEEAV